MHMYIELSGYTDNVSYLKMFIILDAAYRIHNAISRIITADVLKNPMLSDVLNLLRINGISILIHID